MSQDTVVEFRAPGAFDDALTELLRNGAKQLIQKAVEAELAELLEANAHRRDDRGRPAVVRNGYLPERKIVTGVGPVAVKSPKVRSRDGEQAVFHSSLVPPYVRRTANLDAALPWQYG